MEKVTHTGKCEAKYNDDSGDPCKLVLLIYLKTKQSHFKYVYVYLTLRIKEGLHILSVITIFPLPSHSSLSFLKQYLLYRNSQGTIWKLPFLKPAYNLSSLPNLGNLSIPLSSDVFSIVRGKSSGLVTGSTCMHSNINILQLTLKRLEWKKF